MDVFLERAERIKNDTSSECIATECLIEVASEANADGEYAVSLNGETIAFVSPEAACFVRALIEVGPKGWCTYSDN